MGAYTETIKEINKKGNQLSELLDICISIKNEIEELKEKLKLEKSENLIAKEMFTELINLSDIDEQSKLLDDVHRLSKEYELGKKEVFKYQILLSDLNIKIADLQEIEDENIEIQF